MKELNMAVFGGECFWCTEAVFQALKGVISVVSGYAGGTIEKSSYEQVCSGKKGHVEVVRVEFDPDVISYRDLLHVFFATHDPTSINKQGSDVGTQYRSVIFTNSDEQANEAEQIIEELNNSGIFVKPIVTHVVRLTNFYEAEDYHRNYYDNNASNSYCQMIISPKLAKFRMSYNYLLK